MVTAQVGPEVARTRLKILRKIAVVQPGWSSICHETLPSQKAAGLRQRTKRSRGKISDPAPKDRPIANSPLPKRTHGRRPAQCTRRRPTRRNRPFPKIRLDTPTVGYILHMVTIVRTEEFAAWLRGLRDRRAISKVISQVNRMARGNMGDAKAVGEGVSETRIHYGPGYRLYFLVKTERIVLLYGGDKSTQQRDIATAKQLARGIPP